MAVLSDFSGLTHSFIFMFGISFLLASFAISPVKEREIKVDHDCNTLAIHIIYVLIHALCVHML